MLNSITWRRITDSWLIEMENHPKLSVLNTICKSGCCNRCYDVPNKAHRTVHVYEIERGNSSLPHGNWKMERGS